MMKEQETRMDLPALGFGTFRLQGQGAFDATLMALEVGYRHVDTAQLYGNEEQIGHAIKESGLPREKLFLTTKVWMDNLSRVKESVQESLSLLQTPYVDLLLIHWPLKEDMSHVFRQFQEVKEEGLTRHIGVSNFTNTQLQGAVDFLGEGAIYANQVEVHPFLQNKRVVDFCREKNVKVIGYAPFAPKEDLFKNAVLQDIATRNAMTPAQVVLVWMRQSGLATIPSSTQRHHLESNFHSLKCHLSHEDMAMITRMERGQRFFNPEFAPQWEA